MKTCEGNKLTLLSEINQPERLQTVRLQLYNILENGKLYGDNKKINGCQGLGGGRDEWV